MECGTVDGWEMKVGLCILLDGDSATCALSVAVGASDDEMFRNYSMAPPEDAEVS